MWAEDIEGSLCESCRFYCERCECCAAGRHYNSDFETCEYCVADDSLECAPCGEKFWESDLERVDVPWFDQAMVILLCEDCLAESEETEEIYEDFNAGEASRGQLEMTLAMV